MMRKSTTVLLAMLLEAVLGCTSPREPILASPPGVADERDRQVLETALLHLLTTNDFDMTRVEKRDALIVLYARTPEKTGMIQPGQIRGDLDERHTIPEDIQHDLLRRNEQPGSHNTHVASFTGLKFDQQVVVADLAAQQERRKEMRFDAFEKAYPRARGYAEAYLPGYSQDGSQAVVRAWVGPSPHGAVATVFLERSGGTWRVKWCEIGHYI
jgi:hypothetical protein